MAENNKNVTEEAQIPEAESTTSETKEAKAAKTPKKSAKKNKPSFGQRVKKSLKEFKAEFKKIVWSSKRNTFNNTVLVVVSMIVVSVVIGALDTGFSKLLTLLGSIV